MGKLAREDIVRFLVHDDCMGARTSGMVGRDAPLAELLDAATLTSNGEMRSVLVTGEAGIGKSRLVTRPSGSTLGVGEKPAFGGGASPQPC